ncbi:MAG TPA: DUF6789 family protein [Chloroflexota bacterium]
MNRIVRGSASGLAATAAMSAVMVAGKRLELLGTPPPKQITQSAGRRAGGNPRSAPEPAFDAAWLAAHASYGAALGVAYTLVRPLLPDKPTTAGLMYGIGVWAANYAGILPLLGLYPTPGEDSTSRQSVMFAAHLMYGAVLGRTADRLA